MRMSEEERKRRANEWAKKNYHANKEKAREYYKKYNEANKEKNSIRFKEWSDNEKIEESIVYQLPNYNRYGYKSYVGVTSNPSKRRRDHKHLGNNIEGFVILGEYKTREEALKIEANYHSKGHAGKKGFEKSKS